MEKTIRQIFILSGCFLMGYYLMPFLGGLLVAENPDTLTTEEANHV